ncbi:MAG TPA: helix-turn-helix transcriptional regulator [Chloroflexota bacterium]|nr:helix-turn-helix transcriptional regulator [Chloroflexota bacterium]
MTTVAQRTESVEDRPPTVPLPRTARPVRRIGRLARQLRQERGESLYDVAARAGMSAIQLSRIERLQSSPTEEKIAGLAAALEVPICLLFGEVHVPAEPPAADGEDSATSGAGRPGSSGHGSNGSSGSNGGGELEGRPLAALAAGSTAGTAEWLWPAILEWERLLSRLNEPALRLEKRRQMAEVVAKALREQRLTLGQPQLYEELRQVWQTQRGLDERIGAARRLYERYRPRAPEAALIFPRYRYRFEYREDGLCDCWYEFTVANISAQPVLYYDNEARGRARSPMTEDEIGLQITNPSGAPAADIEWLPPVGDATRWRARFLRPLQPGEHRDLVERWVWRYLPPLAGIRNNSDIFVVNAFTSEFEIVVGYPRGYTVELNLAWVRECDGTLRMIDVQLVGGADRPVFLLREALPPFEGSDQLASFSILHKIVKVAGHSPRPDEERR